MHRSFKALQYFQKPAAQVHSLLARIAEIMEKSAQTNIESNLKMTFYKNPLNSTQQFSACN